MNSLSRRDALLISYMVLALIIRVTITHIILTQTGMA
jgi:hypothetical protein